MKALQLPRRHGPQPETTSPSRERPFPHSQVSQIAPEHLQARLLDHVASLPGVSVRDSLVSVPGARAFHLDPEVAKGPAEAFQRGTEFAHLHPAHDGSLHATLPRDLYEGVLDKGWGEPHPISGTMMLFGPRDEQELEVLKQLLEASYSFAKGSYGPYAAGKA
jgi:hypothetical protein